MLFVTFSEFCRVALQVSESLQKALLSSNTRTHRSILRRSTRLPNIKGGNHQRSHSKILTEILITIQYYCNIGTRLLLFFFFYLFHLQNIPLVWGSRPTSADRQHLKASGRLRSQLLLLFMNTQSWACILRHFTKQNIATCSLQIDTTSPRKTSWYYAVLIASWPNIPGFHPASGAGAVSKPACCSEPHISRST